MQFEFFVRARSIAVLSVLLPRSVAASPLAVDATEAARFRFESLRTALESNYDFFLRNMWTTLGFLFVMIGWLVTSEPARQHLANSRRLRYSGASFMIAGALCHAYFIWHLYDTSSELANLLEKNSYANAIQLEDISFRSIALSPTIALMTLILDEAVFFLATYLMLSIPDHISEAGRTFKVKDPKKGPLNPDTTPDANRAVRGRRR